MKSKILFKNQISTNSFTRIDGTHPVNIYLGKDENYRDTLYIICENRPSEVKSSSFIDVFVGQREDEKWALSLSLINTNAFDIFCHFCDDIVESSRLFIDSESGIRFICKRYMQWQEMFKKDSLGLLSKSVIKGILGELIFLKNYLIPQIGEELAINSWTGPEMLPQDFMYNNNWYEVKSVSSKASNVSISSIEQIDVTEKGELVVICLDDTSKTYIDKITINEYYIKMTEMFKCDNSRVIFSSKLLKLGYYPRDEYNHYNFKLSKADRFLVNNEFPALRKHNISDAIISAKYEISIVGINKFHLEEIKSWK